MSEEHGSKEGTALSRMKWVWSIAGLVIVLGVCLTAWWFGGRTSAGVKVKVAAAQNTTLQQEVAASGTVVASKEQNVMVMAPSKVAKVFIHVGDSVKTGQTLIQMDTTLADAQVAQAQAGVNTAQTNLKAAQDNLETLKNAQAAPSSAKVASAGPSAVAQGGSSVPTVDIPMNTPAGPSAGAGTVSAGDAVQQAEMAVSQAQAMLRQAQEGLKVAQAQRAQNIYTASISGTVLALNAQDGSMATPQTPLVVVGDLSQLQVAAQLNEVDAGKVQLGQKVSVTSKVVGNTALSGVVAEIAPQAVSQPSLQGSTPPSVGVKVNLEKVPAELKPGYTVDLTITTATKNNVLAIPQEALFQEGGKNFVFKVINNILAKTEVSIGLAGTTLQEITSGLKAGDLVVLNPTAQLANGLPVTPESGSVTP